MGSHCNENFWMPSDCRGGEGLYHVKGCWISESVLATASSRAVTGWCGALPESLLSAKLAALKISMPKPLPLAHFWSILLGSALSHVLITILPKIMNRYTDTYILNPLRTGALDGHKKLCSDTLIAPCTNYCQLKEVLQPGRWWEYPSLEMFKWHLDMSWVICSARPCMSRGFGPDDLQSSLATSAGCGPQESRAVWSKAAHSPTAVAQKPPESHHIGHPGTSSRCLSF